MQTILTNRDVSSDFDPKWLPDMDLNHDKQIQRLLCYRYTIGQSEARQNLEISN